MSEFEWNQSAESRDNPAVRIMPQWRPIESAPLDRVPLLVCDRYGKMAVAVRVSDEVFGIADPDGRFPDSTLSDGSNFYDITPTHWIPLPEPPK